MSKHRFKKITEEMGGPLEDKDGKDCDFARLSDWAQGTG